MYSNYNTEICAHLSRVGSFLRKLEEEMQLHASFGLVKSKCDQGSFPTAEAVHNLTNVYIKAYPLYVKTNLKN